MDAVCVVGGINALMWGWRSVVRGPPTGLPLACAVLGIALCAGWLPALPTHTAWSGVANGAIDLCVGVDAAQYAVHRWLAHSSWRASHGVHHRHMRPDPTTAFVTGWVDATFQLLVPVIATTWIVRPPRSALVVFGAFYSVWLQWIHRGPAPLWHSHAWERAVTWVCVTPAFHARHHANPACNFGHVLTVWDMVLGTAA